MIEPTFLRSLPGTLGVLCGSIAARSAEVISDWGPRR